MREPAVTCIDRRARAARRYGVVSLVVWCGAFAMAGAPAARAACMPSAPDANGVVAVTCPSIAAEQTFTVPDGISRLRISAAGGFAAGATSSPAVASGTFAVGSGAELQPGELLFVEVGGDGAAVPGGAGGFNGGAVGGFDGGGGGGGASDVRTCTACALTGGPSDPRLIVAGGVGGTGNLIGSANSGGVGGVPDGGSGAGLAHGAGGTTTAGGAPGSADAVAGAAGLGGAGYLAGGGGGGGFWGGGGGGVLGGGGGGSSFVRASATGVSYRPATVQDAPQTVTLTYDLLPPQTAIDAGPTGLVNVPTATFAFSSSEPGSTFECGLDATSPAAFTSCSSPYKTLPLADGPHRFCVRAIDSASNVDPSPACAAFTVNVPPPPLPPPGPPAPPGSPPPPPPPPRPVATCEGRPATIVAAPRKHVITGTAGADVIIATDAADRIDGRGGDDVICAGRGNDRVRGGPGNDVVRGGAGDDRIDGDAGRDLLLGGPGRDQIHGGTGNDRLGSGAGDDRVYGDAGADLFDEYKLGGNGNDHLYGGTGRDRIRTQGGTKDVVDCGPGVDFALLDAHDTQRRCDRVRVARQG